MNECANLQCSLKPTHLALDDVLHFVGQLRLDVLLQTTEQEGPEHLVQTTDDEDRLLLVQLHLLPGDGEGGRCTRSQRCRRP